MTTSPQTRSMMDELYSFDKVGWFDFGHPLLNRVADSFLKATSVAALSSVSRHALSTTTTFDGTRNDVEPNGVSGGAKKQRFPDLRGETNSRSLEAMVKSTGQESLQWGLAAGIYSGLTYGLKEARGGHDWKNSVVAGAITGAALAFTSSDEKERQIAQSAITGAAISTVAHLLTGIF
jgi:hypothetical protein